jgi:hypothetical protein
MAITLKLSDLRGDDRAPLYNHIPGQAQPNPAFVAIEEDGDVWADEARSGNGVPADVWHQRTLRLTVPADVDGQKLADYLERGGRALLERIHAGHEVDWDGSNRVGKLTDDARDAIEQIEREMDDLPRVEVWTASEWLWGGNNDLQEHWPAGMSLDEAVEKVNECIAFNEHFVRGDVRRVLLDEAARMFYDGDALDKCHLDALAADGVDVSEDARP